MKSLNTSLAVLLTTSVAVFAQCISFTPTSCGTATLNGTTYFGVKKVSCTVAGSGAIAATSPAATGSSGTQPTEWSCHWECMGWSADGAFSKQLTQDSGGIGTSGNGVPCPGTGTGPT